MLKQFFNTGKLAKLIYRKSRVSIFIWIITISAFTIIIAQGFTQLFSNEQEMLAMIETLKNPAMISMLGPGYGLDNYTYGAMMGHEMLLFTLLAVAIMNILIVSNHTRGDEEEGRVELIRSLPTGRLA